MQPLKCRDRENNDGLCKINKGLEKNFGISKSVLTPETINYSSGYCEDTIKRAQKQLLEKSAKTLHQLEQRCLKIRMNTYRCEMKKRKSYYIYQFK